MVVATVMTIVIAASTTTVAAMSTRREVLDMEDIRTMRVRDLKWRLTNHHGYTSVEVNRMLDKRELVETLAFEEHREGRKRSSEKRRRNTKHGVMVALVAVVVVTFWPLFRSLWEVIHVNLVVYTDKRKYEISRCLDYRSVRACLGILVMIGIDSLQLWLSVSILASWILPTSSPYRDYTFPMPSLPIRPAAVLTSVLNPGASAGPLGNYGINVAPMLISWFFRTANGKVENWVGRALAKGRGKNVDAEKRRRKAERRERREQRRREEQEKRNNQAAATTTAETNTTDPPPSWCCNGGGCDSAKSTYLPTEPSPEAQRFMAETEAANVDLDFEFDGSNLNDLD